MWSADAVTANKLCHGVGHIPVQPAHLIANALLRRDYFVGWQFFNETLCRVLYHGEPCSRLTVTVEYLDTIHELCYQSIRRLTKFGMSSFERRKEIGHGYEKEFEENNPQEADHTTPFRRQGTSKGKRVSVRPVYQDSLSTHVPIF